MYSIFLTFLDSKRLRGPQKFFLMFGPLSALLVQNRQKFDSNFFRLHHFLFCPVWVLRMKILLFGGTDDRDPKSRRQICEDLKNWIKIKSFVDKAFWDKVESFLHCKAASVALKRGKQLWTRFFNIQQEVARCRRTTSRGAKPLLQLIVIGHAKIYSVIWA